MSDFVPGTPRGPFPDPEHPALLQQPRSAAEQRARWAVRAAQWRAVDLARTVWGSVGRTAMLGMGTHADFRGLLHLEVPFRGLDEHRRLEAVFLEGAAADPILAGVPLLFAVGPAPYEQRPREGRP